MDKPKVIYIAGYGRSGSTLLNRLLGRHEDLFALGEFANLTEWVEANDPCSCGERVRECPFWGEIINEQPAINEGTVTFGFRKSAMLRLAAKWFLRMGLSRDEMAIAKRNQAVISDVLNKTGSTYVVDASKSFGRLFAMLNSGLFDVSVVHLVRDGQGVIASRKKKIQHKVQRHGQYMKHRGAGYVTRRWAITNLLIMLAALMLPRDKYLLIKYEELAKQPNMVVQGILRRAHVGNVEGYDWSNAESGRHHNIGGNIMSYADIKEIRIDDNWKTSLTTWDRIGFAVNGGSLVNGITSIIARRYR